MAFLFFHNDSLLRPNSGLLSQSRCRRTTHTFRKTNRTSTNYPRKQIQHYSIRYWNFVTSAYNQILQSRSETTNKIWNNNRKKHRIFS